MAEIHQTLWRSLAVHAAVQHAEMLDTFGNRPRTYRRDNMRGYRHEQFGIGSDDLRINQKLF